ncbi:hydroxymethylbilane synthase [Sulfoacidibacillus thermotolerans]|uniref:Porphobilinogen deaminase n=1 Tax=Sulfoacidibacillus thermotolerans TaxID=1765684 RepID=A0A2U3DC43_SULT2|nr:hydroxymethylbilane synthase [Sulfoacidibacillus thermotolerans]PWI58851.1 hydroxymethylbilane synthase [Sulfoacidibacillus thermotolerans]
MRSLIVGTRRSLLAKTQTGHVVQALREQFSDLQIEVKEIVTKGDRILDVALSEVGGKGLFISEIEAALLTGEIDFAVHSLKDVPAQVAPGLTLGAIPKREDERDVLVTKHGQTIRSLPQNARIGTSSLRRSAQLRSLREDVQIEILRGNIDTRLGRLGELDAIVLAAAGLSRMGWWDGEGNISYHGHTLVGYALPLHDFLPAVGQGALALECRADDQEVLQLLQAVHDPFTARQVLAERAFLQAVGGSCQVPIGAHATIENEATIRLEGMIGAPDGSEMFRGVQRGENPQEIGELLGEHLLQAGGAQILRDLQIGTR